MYKFLVEGTTSTTFCLCCVDSPGNIGGVTEEEPAPSAVKPEDGEITFAPVYGDFLQLGEINIVLK